MKKSGIVAAVWIGIIVLFRLFEVSAAASDYTILTDGVNSPCLQIGKTEVVWRVSSQKEQEAILCAAVYTEEIPTQVGITPCSLKTGENTLKSNTVSVQNDTSCVRLFLLEKNNLTPIAEPLMLNIAPMVEKCTVMLGKREYTADIDEQNQTITFEVPLYYVKDNTQTAEIQPNFKGYENTPSPEECKELIRAAKPNFKLTAGSVQNNADAVLDLTREPTVTIENPDNGEKRSYTLAVNLLTVQRDTDLTGVQELVAPTTTTYQAGQNPKRYNAPLRSARIGSGIWAMENFAYRSLAQDTYDPSLDRTDDTAGYNTSTKDGLLMHKDRSGKIALYATESSSPVGNIKRTVTQTALSVRSMTGDGMKIYFGEGRFVLRLVPKEDNTAAVLLGIGDRWDDTGAVLAYDAVQELRMITETKDAKTAYGSLYINGKWIYSMSADTDTLYRLNRFHVKYEYLENTRAEVLLKSWSLAYQKIDSDENKPLDVVSAEASDDDGHAAKNVLDRDYDTRWSAKGDKKTLTVQLAQLSDIGYIGAAFYMGNERSYTVDIELSEDGINYTSAVVGYRTQKTQDMQAIPLNDTVKAKYVRIIGYGNDQNKWNSITELSVYPPYRDGNTPVARDGAGQNRQYAGLSEAQQTAVLKFEEELERIYPWLANLYDGETGGFYMAKSGADDPDMAPALEMTFFALNIAKSYGDSWGDLPESVKRKFIRFITDRQDAETGLFIDTQGWANDREVSRNQSAVLSWVNYWNISLPYSHPSLAKKNTPTLLASAESSNNILPDYLETPETYREWIASWDWDNNSWTAGDQIGCSLVYLKYLDSGYEEYRKVLLDWLSERQFEDTGLWAPKINYNSISGAFKMGLVYESLGEKIPHADQIVESTFTCLKTQTPDVVHYARNPISLLNQIASYGEEYETKIRKYVLENLELILSQTEIFSSPDGGYSMYRGKSMESFGGVTGSHQLNEGDVDSTVMILSMRNDLYNILGITTTKIPMGEDFWNWIAGTEKLPSPYTDKRYDKTDAESLAQKIDFENFSAGTILNGTELGGGNSGKGMTAKIVKDAEKNGNVLAIDYHASQSQGPSFWLRLGNDITAVRYLGGEERSAAVIEYDIKASGTATNNFYVSYGKNAYMLSFGGSGAQKISCRVNPNQIYYGGVFATIEQNKWYRLRLVCTRNKPASEFRCRIYCKSADAPDTSYQLVSDNPYFYDCLSSGASPAEPYGKFGIVWYRAGNGTLYLDNLSTCLTKAF